MPRLVEQQQRTGMGVHLSQVGIVTHNDGVGKGISRGHLGRNGHLEAALIMATEVVHLQTVGVADEIQQAVPRVVVGRSRRIRLRVFAPMPYLGHEMPVLPVKAEHIAAR